MGGGKEEREGRSGGWESEDEEDRELRKNSQPRTPTSCHRKVRLNWQSFKHTLTSDLPQGLSQGSLEKEEEEEECATDLW